MSAPNAFNSFSHHPNEAESSSHASKKRPHDFSSSENGVEHHGAKKPKVEEISNKSDSNGDRSRREPISRAFGVLVQPSLNSTDDSAAPTNSMTGAGVGLQEPLPQPSLVVPHHAEWFDMKEIHEYERKALPEFFLDRPARSSNKSAEIYREYRDFMIHAYQQNPAQYLNYTSCRRSLAGDACAVLRVFDFLTSVGLINYAVNPDVQGLLPSPAPLPSASDAGKYLLRLDNPPEYSAERSNLALRSLLSMADANIPHTPRNIQCSSCHEDNLQLAFQSKDPKPKTLCSNCFYSSVPESSREDYNRIDKRVEAVIKEEHNPWTKDETFALIDAVEKFGDDWEKVARAVGSRDVESCILQFIRLPIEDPYYSAASSFEKANKDLGNAGRSSSNAQAPNPLMQLMAFLTRTLSPKIASAASQAAIKAYMEEKQLSSNTTSEEPVDQASKSSMDVDTNGRNEHANEPLNPKEEKELQDLTAVASAGLASAVLKASLLSEKEERDMRRAILHMIDAQYRKMELKMKYFDEMERFLDDEHKRLEAKRAQVLEEKWQVEQERRRLHEQQSGAHY